MDKNKSYWTKIKTFTKSEYFNPAKVHQITEYWRPNIKLTDTEFTISGGINHTLGGKGVNVLAADSDYSKPSDEPYTKSAIVAAVFGSFAREQYAMLIREIIQKGGLGTDVDAFITCSKPNNPDDKSQVFFIFNFGDPESDLETTISYTDCIKLFHEYFNTFKHFVDDYAPEVRDQTQQLFTGKKDENGEPIFGDFPWYPDFLKELENLNKLYDELVAKG